MQLVIGIVIGAIILYVLKDKLPGAKQASESSKQELNTLYAENEKFSKQNKELQRQVEDLTAEVNKLRRKSKDADADHDDLEDERDKAKRDLRDLRIQYDTLSSKLKEYENALAAKEAEIVELKNKIG